jgi:hypothetical protein
MHEGMQDELDARMNDSPDEGASGRSGGDSSVGTTDRRREDIEIFEPRG